MKMKFLGFACAAAAFFFDSALGLRIDRVVKEASPVTLTNGTVVPAQEANKLQRLYATKADFDNNLPKSIYKDTTPTGAANAITEADAKLLPGALKMALDADVADLAAGQSGALALEVLYTALVTNARVADAANPVKVDGSLGQYLPTLAPNDVLGTTYTSAQYLQALAQILKAGRAAADQYDTITAAVWPAVRHLIRNMISVATAAELGIK